eukprot:8564089-Alexandrium_andersonii.AAC.1
MCIRDSRSSTAVVPRTIARIISSRRKAGGVQADRAHPGYSRRTRTRTRRKKETEIERGRAQ